MLLAAFALSRGCATAGENVSRDEAVAIARKSIGYEPDRVQVRFLRRGAPNPVPTWVVSLYTLDAKGRPAHITVVVVDARTGAIQK